MKTYYVVDMLSNPVSKLVKFTKDDGSNRIDVYEQLDDYVPYDFCARGALKLHIMDVFERTKLARGSMYMDGIYNLSGISTSHHYCRYAIVEEKDADSVIEAGQESCWYYAVPRSQFLLSGFAKTISPACYVDLYRTDTPVTKPVQGVMNFQKGASILKRFYTFSEIDDTAIAYILYSVLLTASLTWVHRAGYIQYEEKKVPAIESSPMEAFSALHIIGNMNVVEAAQCIGINIEELVEEYPCIKEINATVQDRCLSLCETYPYDIEPLRLAIDWVNKVYNWIKSA